jgi:hypothetical protein
MHGENKVVKIAVCSEIHTRLVGYKHAVWAERSIL